MTSKTRLSASLVLLLGLFAFRAFADDPPTSEKKPPAAADEKKPAPNHVLVTISKETTVITQPLRKDGYVDYIAALNEIYGKGVTPESNAVVLIWKAQGPTPLEQKYWAEYFRLLGVPVPAEKGDYFFDLDEFLRKQNPVKNSDDSGRLAAELKKIDDQFYLAVARPWSAKEFPILATWLAANKKALDVAVEASRRPRYFDPLVGGNDTLLIEVFVPSVHDLRGIARALRVRATLLMGEGKTDAAWQDLLAVHRLGRLCGQGPFLLQALVAVTIENIACDSEKTLLQNSLLSAEDALRMRNELSKLAPLPKMDEKIDREERFMFLDCVAYGARNGPASIGQLAGGPRVDSAMQSIFNTFAREATDWDVILRTGNSWYDRLVEALRKPSQADRTDALKKIDLDLRAEMQRAKNWVPSSLTDLRHELAERIGRVYVSLLLPAVTAVANPQHAAEMRFELIKLAFSLAAYRADHGSYPIKLKELVPKYVSEIPKDIFNASELHYKPDGDSYVLYSVGPNGKDDGGRDQDDDKNDVGWDDIVVRVRKAP